MGENQITRNNVINLWGRNYPDVMRWLGKLQKKDASCYHLYRFCQWANIDPKELLTLKDNPASTRAEELLDDFVNDDTPQFTNAIKFNMATAVKSFFKHNYKDLAKASGHIELIQQKEHHKPRKEDLLKLWNYAQNLRDKSLITFVNSTALAKETLSALELRYFEEGWEQKELPYIDCPSEILKGHGKGRYRGVRQITFLTPEAKRDFLNYKEWIEKRMSRKLEPTDKIWRNICKPYEPLDYNRLGTLIVGLSKEAGVHFSLHDGRRMVETSLEEVGIHPNWARKIRGRKVRGEEAPYSQPEIEKLREKYRQAVPLLQFTSKESISINENDLRIKIALDNLRQSCRFSDATLKQMEAEWMGKEAAIAIPNMTIEAEALERIAAREGFDSDTQGVMIPKDYIAREMETIKRERSKPKVQHDGGCEGGKHCQRIVTEPEAETLLNQGWHVITCLPSGKIVVSNDR